MLSCRFSLWVFVPATLSCPFVHFVATLLFVTCQSLGGFPAPPPPRLLCHLSSFCVDVVFECVGHHSCGLPTMALMLAYPLSTEHPPVHHHWRPQLHQGQLQVLLCGWRWWRWPRVRRALLQRGQDAQLVSLHQRSRRRGVRHGLVSGHALQLQGMVNKTQVTG